MVGYRQRGYGSMVEHLVANQMMGVRFSLPAQNEEGPEGGLFHFVRERAPPIRSDVSPAGETTRRGRGSSERRRRTICDRFSLRS
jgi:hypothetical protein